MDILALSHQWVSFAYFFLIQKKVFHPQGDKSFFFLMMSWLLQYGVSSYLWTSLEHLSTTWETRVRSLGQEDPLEKEMATHSSILTWEIPWTEEPGRLQLSEAANSWT